MIYRYSFREGTVANSGDTASIEAAIKDLVYQGRSRGRGGFGELGGAGSVGLGSAVKSCLLEGEVDEVRGTGRFCGMNGMESIKMRRYESNSLIGAIFSFYTLFCSVCQARLFTPYNSFPGDSVLVRWSVTSSDLTRHLIDIC